MWWFGASIAACRSSPKCEVAEKHVQRPLVLLVAARRAEREVRLAVARDQRRRERRARPLARRERVRQALLQPEHLRARAEAEPELGHDRCAPEPAAARRRRDHVPEAVDDVQVHGVAFRPGARRLADAGRLGVLGALSTVARRGSRPTVSRGGASDDASSSISVRRSSAYSRESSTSSGTSTKSGSPYHASRSANASFADSVIAWTYAARVVPERGEVEALEQPQLLQEDRRLAPRPGLEDGQAVVVDRERLLVARPPVAQVLLGEQPRWRSPELSSQARSREAGHRLGDEPAVPACRGRPRSDRRGPSCAPRPPRARAGRSPRARGCGRACPARRRAGTPRPRSSTRRGRAARHCGSHRRPAAASDSRPPRSRSRSGARRAGAACRSRAASPASRRTRPGRPPASGPVPGNESQAELVAVVRDRRRPRRRPLRAEHDRLVAPGRPEQRGQVAARAVQVRLDDLQRQPGGDRGVERVPAALEHRHAGRRREPVRRGDHAEGAAELGAGREAHPAATISAASAARRGAGRPRATRWQATRWPGANSASGGSSSVDAGADRGSSGQRVRKRQPDGGASGLGTSPSSSTRRARALHAWVGHDRGREQRLGVRDAAGCETARRVARARRACRGT